MSKIKNTFKIIVVLLVVALIGGLTVGCTSQSGSKGKPRELIMTCYGGAYQEFFEKEVIPEFEEKHNCKVKLAVGLAKDWMAELRAGGVNNPPYDVVMTNEIWASQERREGYFVELPTDKIPNLDNALIRNKNDNGVIGIIQPIGIAYRTDMVENPPKSWKDLWKDEYKGKIGLYTITNSAGMMFLLATAEVFTGDQHNLDVAFEKIKELKPFKQTDFSGDMEKLLSIGEVSMGVLDAPAVARLKKKGISVEWVAPEEGMFMFEQDFNVTKGSKVKDLTYNWINYILSDKIQKKLVERFYVTPGCKGIKVPEDLKELIPIRGERVNDIWIWDWNYVNDRKQEIINRWNREISG